MNDSLFPEEPQHGDINGNIGVGKNRCVAYLDGDPLQAGFPGKGINSYVFNHCPVGTVVEQPFAEIVFRGHRQEHQENHKAEQGTAENEEPGFFPERFIHLSVGHCS